MEIVVENLQDERVSESFTLDLIVFYTITGQICYKKIFEEVLEENLPPPILEGTKKINHSMNLRSLIRKEFCF